MKLPLHWQERKIGDVSFVLENFTLYSVEGQALALPVDDLINDNTRRFLESSQGELSMSTLVARGITLTLDAKDLVVVLELTPAAMAVDQLTYGNRNYFAKPSKSAGWAILNNLNLRIDESNIEQDDLSFEWLAEANFGGHDGYNLNWSAFFEQNEDRTETYRGDITLFKDHFATPLRYEIGDLSSFNRGHLPSLNAGGIGISTPYQELQPLKRISPTNSQEFYIKQSAEIQVIVNSNIVAKVRVSPGRYDLNDLPLSTGQNDVEVLATYANGEQETFTFNTFYNSQLLEQGLSIYAFNIGYPSQFSDFKFDYLDPLVMTGFYETGITDTLSAGINALYTQGNYLLGSTATLGSKYGNFSARLTTGDFDGIKGYALSLDSEHTVLGSSEFGVPNLRLSYQKRKDFVQSPWLTSPIANTDAIWSLNYSWYLSQKLDFNVTARWNKDQNEKETKNVTAQLNWRYQNFRISAQYQRQEDDLISTQDENTFFINLNWSRFNSVSGTRSRFDYRSQNDDLRAGYAKINRNYVGDYGYSIDANRTPDLEAVSMAASYTHNRFRIDASSRSQKRAGLTRSNDHRINISTSIAIADGKVGMGSNVRAPFALIETHKTLEDATVDINPSPNGDKQGVADGDITGLVGLGSSFTENVLTIDAQNTPLGYDWGPGTYSIVGGTNTAHIITIGSDLSYTAIGYVKDAENTPIALQRGTITAANFSGNVFTNRKGRFVIEGIGPGDYVIEINGKKAQITIKESDISLIRLGNITLRDP